MSNKEVELLNASNSNFKCLAILPNLIESLYFL